MPECSPKCRLFKVLTLDWAKLQNVMRRQRPRRKLYQRIIAGEAGAFFLLMLCILSSPPSPYHSLWPNHTASRELYFSTRDVQTSWKLQWRYPAAQTISRHHLLPRPQSNILHTSIHLTTSRLEDSAFHTRKYPQLSSHSGWWQYTVAIDQVLDIYWWKDRRVDHSLERRVHSFCYRLGSILFWPSTTTPWAQWDWIRCKDIPCKRVVYPPSDLLVSLGRTPQGRLQNR